MEPIGKCYASAITIGTTKYASNFTVIGTREYRLGNRESYSLGQAVAYINSVFDKLMAFERRDG